MPTTNPLLGVFPGLLADLSDFNAFDTATLVTAFDFNADGNDDLLFDFDGELGWFEILPFVDDTILGAETELGAYTAADSDGDSLLYSISGGSDQALFNIDASTGELSLTRALSAEQARDANADNIYEVRLSVSDGFYTTTRLFRFQASAAE